MTNTDELLTAVREARRELEGGKNYQALDMLALFEGLVPFIDRESIIRMKCAGCDSFASSYFPLENDFWAVYPHEYCYAKRISLQNLSIFKLAECSEYRADAQRELVELANSILEEDLVPAITERKLYDKRRFASYKVAFEITEEPNKVGIRFGHKEDNSFVRIGINLYIIRRLDPGFGGEASKKISAVLKEKPVMVVDADVQTRRMLDIDYVLVWIAKKRKMDIVYL